MRRHRNESIMTKGLSTILLAFVMLITFPIWIGLIAGGFGIVVGIFAAIFGVVAGAFGLVVGIVGGLLDFIFSGIFGWGNYDLGFSFPHFHFNRFVLAAFVIVLAIVISKRRGSKKD
ncbi:MAG: hypothetical protein RLN86_09435 [Cyclobacteriaceae bacterium]